MKARIAFKLRPNYSDQCWLQAVVTLVLASAAFICSCTMLAMSGFSLSAATTYYGQLRPNCVRDDHGVS